ncbi:MAG: hypothetical protein ACQEP1_03040 [Nanobdellota archaeon]
MREELMEDTEPGLSMEEKTTLRIVKGMKYIRRIASKKKDEPQIAREIARFYNRTNHEIDIGTARRSLIFSQENHKGQYRNNDFPEYVHGANVGYITARLLNESSDEFRKAYNIDDLITASNLHDTIENTKRFDIERIYSLIDNINNEFGKDPLAMALIVSGLDEYILEKHMDEIEHHTQENMNGKDLVSHIKDYDMVPADMIKTADRLAELYNMNEIRPLYGETGEKDKEEFINNTKAEIKPVSMRVDKSCYLNNISMEVLLDRFIDYFRNN